MNIKFGYFEYEILFLILRNYLKAVTWLGFLSGDVQNWVDKLSSFSIVTFGPVISGARLSKNEVIGAENLSKGSGSDRVHGTGLQIDENSTGDIFASGSLNLTLKKKNDIFQGSISNV